MYDDKSLLLPSQSTPDLFEAVVVKGDACALFSYVTSLPAARQRHFNGLFVGQLEALGGHE